MQTEGYAWNSRISVWNLASLMLWLQTNQQTITKSTAWAPQYWNLQSNMWYSRNFWTTTKSNPILKRLLVRFTSVSRIGQLTWVDVGTQNIRANLQNCYTHTGLAHAWADLLLLNSIYISTSLYTDASCPPFLQWPPPRRHISPPYRARVHWELRCG